jgi:hypothetical protein
MTTKNLKKYLSKGHKMEPPWIKFPDIKWGSIGWKMAPGETYWLAWGRWYDELTDQQKIDYKNQWVEPEGWGGFFCFIEHGVLPDWIIERTEKARAEKT